MRRRETRLVDYLDSRSAPRVFHFGEEFLVEKLPRGTRVVYPNPPLQPLANVDAAIRYALSHPEGCEPLYALLRPGMKLTIAVDDISLPLPMMKTPDVRQRMLEIVLDLCADYGVDDIEIVVATAVHRRMHDGEIKRMVGPRVWKDFWPERLYNYDAEDPEGNVHLGDTELGERAIMHRRSAESDLLVYLNINLVPMDGGHKSYAIGLAPYESLRAHHNPQTMLQSHSYMDHTRSALADSATRLGRVIQKKVKIFHVETVLNNKMFEGPLDFLMKREDELSRLEQIKMDAMRWSLSQMPRAARRKVFFSVPAGYGVAAVHAGETEAAHAKTLEWNYRQYCVPVKGQADVMITGVPFVSPYNVNSIMNPILVQVMALGYLFNFYRKNPLLKKGGVLIVTHPLYDEFNAEHHPSYIEFFHRVLPETRDSFELSQKYERQFATDPSYIQMYRKGHAYHGTHPFYMWYWGDAGRAHVGKVICVGAESQRTAEILGWETAPTIAEAIEMAKTFTGKTEPEITHFHIPPILMTDVEA